MSVLQWITWILIGLTLVVNAWTFRQIQRNARLMAEAQRLREETEAIVVDIARRLQRGSN